MNEIFEIYTFSSHSFQVTGHNNNAIHEYKRTSLDMQQSGYLATSASFIDSAKHNCKTEKRKVSIK